MRAYRTFVETGFAAVMAKASTIALSAGSSGDVAEVHKALCSEACCCAARILNDG
jgi:hypothetical protein